MLPGLHPSLRLQRGPSSSGAADPEAPPAQSPDAKPWSKLPSWVAPACSVARSLVTTLKGWAEARADKWGFLGSRLAGSPL